MRKALYILADLDDRDIAWLSETGVVRSVAEGELLIREGAVIDQLYIVIDGELEVVVGDGKRVAELVAGDIVGEMSLIEKRPPAASVRSMSEAKVLAVPQVAIRHRLAKDTACAARFYRALAVFLSDRLRSTVATFGYGKPGAESRQQALERENELDEVVLDTLHVAGDRMRRLVAMLEGRSK